MGRSIVQLPRDAGDELEVYVNGVLQQPDVDYYVDRHAIVFEDIETHRFWWSASEEGLLQKRSRPLGDAASPPRWSRGSFPQRARQLDTRLGRADRHRCHRAAALVRRDRLSGWRWFLGAWGVGTYRQDDTVDVRYETDGGVRSAHKLAITVAEDEPSGDI
jgi:hypothetical protein